MLKLANQVVDAYDDVERTELRKLAQLRPDLMYMNADERAALHDTDFALSVITKKASKLNKFPVDGPDNTFLSNHFFELHHDRLPKLAAETAAFHIKKACERHGIAPSPAVVGMAKEASSNIYYEGTEELRRVDPVQDVTLDKIAAVKDISDNYTHAQYAFKTPAHVKMACQYFEEKHTKIPVEYRHKYASAIQQRAKELGMPVQGGTVAKYASDHYSGQVDAHIRARLSLLEVADPALRESFEKLAGAKKELTPSQFAVVLHGFDKRAGLSRYYGGHLTDPFLATFGKEPDPYAGMRFKTASADLSVDELRRLAIEKHAQIKNYFGQTLADSFKADPTTIFESLPMDAKEIIGNIAGGLA